ncbi:MAG: SpoIIE family protein phosphatase [Pirellulales bacterium]|nr:SpoIIE family protein phosphatase [Pirellulales bacterium]
MTSVADANLSHLRIYQEEKPQPPRPEHDCAGSLPDMLRAFKRLTGWSLEYLPSSEASLPNDLTWSAPVDPGVGVTPGHLRLGPVRSSSAACVPSTDPKPVYEMASALAGMLSELLRTRHSLWQREAELAAGVPLVSHTEGDRHLAHRLQAVLKGAAEAVRGDAVAMYLLDEATSHLKLRACWGLPQDRLTAPPRPLANALADLEAMLGHAVVLEDTTLLAQWNVPEDCRAAACVPVSSPTTILGTLWVFSREPRDFTESQTGMLEIVAGRISAELEREMLLQEGVDAARLKRELASAERLQRNQLPSFAPLLDGWDIAGWTEQAAEVGGDFHDWFCLPNGLFAVTIGSAGQSGAGAAVVAANARTALRSHAQYHREADRLLRQANLTLWTGSAGDQTASLFCAMVETATGNVSYASSGRPSAILLQPHGWQSLVRPSLCLGEDPEAEFEPQAIRLRPGEALLLFTQGCRDTRDQTGHPLGEVALADFLTGRLATPSKDLVALARDRFASYTRSGAKQDRTILLLKRTNP